MLTFQLTMLVEDFFLLRRKGVERNFTFSNFHLQDTFVFEHRSSEIIYTEIVRVYIYIYAHIIDIILYYIYIYIYTYKFKDWRYCFH